MYNKSIGLRGKTQCKGPEASVCMKENKEATMSIAEWTR